MLVLTSLPEARSRLGHYFHTSNSADGPQQKIILIRLAEYQETKHIYQNTAPQVTGWFAAR